MYFFEFNCMIKLKIKKLIKIIELNPYPIFKVMDNMSPPVSPKVVAQIFMIQKIRFTSAILRMAFKLKN